MTAIWLAFLALCLVLLTREVINNYLSHEAHRENLAALTGYVYPPEVTNLNDGPTFTIGCDIVTREVEDANGYTLLVGKPDPDRSWIKCHMCGRTSYNENDIHWRFCGYCHHHHEHARSF